MRSGGLFLGQNKDFYIICLLALGQVIKSSFGKVVTVHRLVQSTTFIRPNRHS